MVRITRVKRALLASGRSGKTHLCVDAAQNGLYSYPLCRGIESIGKHQDFASGEPDFMGVCSECAKRFARIQRKNGATIVNPA